MIHPAIDKGLSHVRLLLVEVIAIIVILWAEVHACIFFGYLNESVVEPPKGSRALQIESDGYAAARALADDGLFDVENVITISTAEDLRSISNDLDGDYVLANDIDLQNEPWEPIGTSGDGAFRGTFDGNGHTISGLNISGTYRGEKAAGLFGMVVGGRIRRLRVTGTIQVSTTSSGGNEGTILAVGGIAAALSHSAIMDCSVDVDIVAAGTGEALPRTGGICGIAKESLIRNCTAYGSVRASATKGRNCSAGLISGRMVSGTNADTVIANCYVQGYVSADEEHRKSESDEYQGYAGGIDGSGADCLIENCMIGEGTQVVSGLYADRFSASMEIEEHGGYAHEDIAPMAPRPRLGRDVTFYSADELAASWQAYLTDMGWDVTQWSYTNDNGSGHGRLALMMWND